MTLKNKFTLLSAVAIALIIAAGIYNFYALNKMVAGARHMEKAGRLMRTHDHADLMHNTLYGRVMEMLYAHESANAPMLGKTQAAAEQDSHVMLKDMEVALTLDPPESIRHELFDVQPAATAFIALANEMIRTIVTDVAEDTRKAAALLPRFEEAYGALSAKNDKLTARLDEWSKEIAAEREQAMLSTTAWNSVIALLIVLIAAASPVFARLQVFGPLEKIIGAMKGLSEGRLEGDFAGADRKDEIGEIARALDIFRANAQEKAQLEKEAEDLKKRAEDDRRRALFGLADNFEARVKRVADTVAMAANEMDAASRDVMRRADASTDKLGLLVNGIAGASQNVQTVASAAAELSASIHEIASQVGHGSQIMRDAVAEAGRANDKAASLSEAAGRIGSVIDVINDITGQINLLALNATIEAARAGEHGRGFAVVASEVKSLAGQTSAATRQIEEQISFIQSAAADTVAVMQEVAGTIDEMSKISASIAAAVEEQGMATQEIARNVQETAEITRGVSENANDVRQSSAGASSAFSQMIAAASDLSRQSESLRGQVGAFLREIKAA